MLYLFATFLSINESLSNIITIQNRCFLIFVMGADSNSLFWYHSDSKFLVSFAFVKYHFVALSKRRKFLLHPSFLGVPLSNTKAYLEFSLLKYPSVFTYLTLQIVHLYVFVFYLSIYDDGIKIVNSPLCGLLVNRSFLWIFWLFTELNLINWYFSSLFMNIIALHMLEENIFIQITLF